MPAKPPDGCLTRPEAAKRFNRSQRALERDLNLAVSIRDADVLDHWYLVTKDGDLRGAAEVETEDVKQLVADGMTPTWYVEELWLEQEYGRKGTAAPRLSPERDIEPLSQPASEPPDPNRPPDTTPDLPQDGLLSADTEFLRERIRTLEREKQEEAVRAENREARLFEQLAVKDRQINSWDEITQGLTRGLATGQLVLKTPAQPASVRSRQDAGKESGPVQAATVVRNTAAVKRAGTKKKKSAPRPKARAKTTPPPSVFQKHTPTFYKVASGLLRRS